MLLSAALSALCCSLLAFRISLSSLLIGMVERRWESEEVRNEISAAKRVLQKHAGSSGHKVKTMQRFPYVHNRPDSKLHACVVWEREREREMRDAPR